MTPTELKLTAIHKGPVARLADISKQYLGMEPAEAAKLAALNTLPLSHRRTHAHSWPATRR